MLRRWTHEETRALQVYVDTHVGHCGGLNGVYWNELSLVLEGVRKDGATVLQKHQVINKIISFGKRKFSCRQIIEFGTGGGPVSVSEKHEESSASRASRRTTTNIAKPSPVFDGDSHEYPEIPRNHEVVEFQAENEIMDRSVPVSRPGPRLDLGSISPSRAQFRRESITLPQSRTHSESQLSGCETRKRTRPDEPHSSIVGGKRSNKKSRESRAERKRSRREESCQGEDGIREGPRCSPNHKETEKVDRMCQVTYEHELERATEDTSLLQEQVTVEECNFAYTTASLWRDSMLHSWHNHLAYQNILNVPHSEPLSHRDVSYKIESISRHVNEASLAFQRMFPHQTSASNFGVCTGHITCVLTGCKTQSEAEDILRVSQSMRPLLTCTNFSEALIGASIHQWVFEDFRSSTSDFRGSDPVRIVFDQFIERECPKLWTSYQNLHHLQLLSSYTTIRVADEAEKLANDAYTLLSTIYSSTVTMQSAQVDKLNSSIAFAAQTHHYQAFKANMIQAYRLALDLRVSFSKCCDLVYEFQFPKIRDNFDPSYMEARKSSNHGCDDNQADVDDQFVAVGLLPSIWSRKSNENDVDKAKTLVAKAVVLL